MKLLAAPKYLSDAIAPLMILNYLLGLRIVEYPRGNLRTVPNLIYLLLILGILYTCVQEHQIFFKQVQIMKLESIMFKIDAYIHAFVITYKVILGCFYTKQLNVCYRKIAQIDDTLRQLGSVFNYREIYLFTVGAIIVWLLYIIVLSSICIIQLESITSVSTLIWITVCQFYVLSFNFVVVEFSMFVKCLQMKFKLINELLSEGAEVSSTKGIKLDLFAAKDYAKNMDTKQFQHIPLTNKFSQLKRQLQSQIRISVLKKRNSVRFRPYVPFQFQKQFQMKLRGQSGYQFQDSNLIQKSIITTDCNRERKHLLQTIRQVHLELCRSSKTLCTSFGIQITSDVGISIMSIIGVLYLLYSHLTEESHKIGISSNNEVLILLIVVISYMLKLIFINYICKKATDEGKKTNEIIHTIYGCYTDVDVQEEIQQFGLQILQSPVYLFTFGISLSYIFLSSCLKTITNHVVIMIQIHHDTLGQFADSE